MRINKASTMWTCENCDYELSADEFEDDYVFWFCDECEAYLNDQDGFDRNASKHICQNCGYENDTTLDNIKGICSDCGKVIANPEAPYCHRMRDRKAMYCRWCNDSAWMESTQDEFEEIDKILKDMGC